MAIRKNFKTLRCFRLFALIGIFIFIPELKGDIAAAANGEGGACKHTLCRLHTALDVLDTRKEESSVLVVGLVGILPQSNSIYITR